MCFSSSHQVLLPLELMLAVGHPHRQAPAAWQAARDALASSGGGALLLAPGCLPAAEDLQALQRALMDAAATARNTQALRLVRARCESGRANVARPQPGT